MVKDNLARKQESLEQDIIDEQNNSSRNAPTGVQSLKNYSPEELKEIQQRHEESVINQSVQKIQAGQPLSPEELQVVNQSSLLDDSIKEQLTQRSKEIEEFIAKNENLQKIQEKLVKGQKITKEEERVFNRALIQQEYSDEKHKGFLEQSKQFVAQGGGKGVHWTDPHLRLDDLETKLGMVLDLNSFDPEEDLFLNTGDILPDLLDQQEHGIDFLNPYRIAKEGGLNAKETDMFVSEFEKLMQYSGLSITDIESGGATLGENGNELLQRFFLNLRQDAEPDHLSSGELSEFRNTREKVHKHLRKAIQGHARKGYETIKQAFERYGLNPSNTLLVAGNHDVESAMWDILGDYMISPGQTKEVQGTKFGNLISGSSGEALGFHLSDELAWRDARKDPKTLYSTQAFQKLKNRLHDIGMTQINDDSLKSLISFAKQKTSLGIGNSELAQYFEARIKPEFNQKVDEIAANFKKIDPKSVDFFVGHGDPSSPYAGAEEKEVHKFLKGSNKAYIHGHLHYNSSHSHDGVHYINPGKGDNLSHGVYLFDKNKEMQSILFAAPNPLDGTLTYQRTNLDNLTAKDSNYGQSGGGGGQ